MSAWLEKGVQDDRRIEAKTARCQTRKGQAFRTDNLNEKMKEENCPTTKGLPNICAIVQLCFLKWSIALN